MSNASTGPIAATCLGPLVYEDARECIADGDLIAVRSRSGLVPWLTRLVTDSPYTHTGVALWMEGRLLLVETRGVASLVPLSQHARHDFDVIRNPLPGKQGQWNVKKAIFALLGSTIRYDYLDLLFLAAHELADIPLPEHDNRRLLCSALSASIYLRAGWCPAGLPSIPAPRDVVRSAGSVAIQVRTAVQK